MWCGAAANGKRAPAVRHINAAHPALALPLQLESLRRQLAEATRALEHWQREAAVRKVAQEELQSRVEQEQGRRLQALYMVGGLGVPAVAGAQHAPHWLCIQMSSWEATALWRAAAGRVAGRPQAIPQPSC